MANGQAIAALALPLSATFTSYADTAAAYQFLDGTSMATPHVTAAVAFAAMNFPGETMAQRIARILGNVSSVPALGGKVATVGTLNLLKMIDTDADALPDWWETEQLGSLAGNASADPDVDGFTNADEFLAGTAPDSAASKLAFSSMGSGSGSNAGDFILSFPTITERTYKVEWTDDLKTWNTLATLTGTGSPATATDAGARSASNRRFYRLQVLGL